MPANLPGFQRWMTAARPVGHGMIAIPLLWGQAVALVTTSQFAWQWFFVIHVFGFLTQVYILYLNDYADEAIDRLNETYWLSGGSRVIPDGLLSGQQLFKGAMVALFFLLVVSAICFALGRIWMPLLGVTAVILGWTYSLSPLKASYRGVGELHQSLCCGVYLPVMAFYLQSGSLENFPWMYLLPVCLIFFASNIVTAIPDVATDRMGNKKTYPVRHGGVKARRDALQLLLVACLLIAVLSAVSARLVSGLVICVPPIVLLLYVYQSGLVQNADAEYRVLCKRYIVLTVACQLWLMMMWTIFLFEHGLREA